MSPRIAPEPSETSQPFWDASREQLLVVQRCVGCEAFVWYPRPFCPSCLRESLEWTEVSGLGTVYAVSVHHRGPSAEMNERAPYAVALVDLVEGVRLMSNVEGCDPSEVHVGQRVRATWEPLEDGRHLLLFAPERAGS
jgi:uncharacterized OB-fold protein